MKQYYVYILTNRKNGSLYTGITSDLLKRVWEHKNKVIKGFTGKYNIDKLIYYEEHSTATEAISREKIIKSWKRNWKISLIETDNPNWNDLYDSII